MAFLETPRFPVDLNYGSMGGPVFKTDVVMFGNGSEYRNARWSIPLHRYDVRYAVKTRADLLNVYEFFIAQQGRANGFRVKDLWDFTTASDGKSAPATNDMTIGTGDGIEVDFQLLKNYTKGAETTARNILKPVAGTTVVEVNGTPTTAFTIDTATGIITMNVAPPNTHVVKAGCEFDVPVRFDTDDLSGVQLLLYTTTGADIASIEAIPLVEIR